MILGWWTRVETSGSSESPLYCPRRRYRLYRRMFVYAAFCSCCKENCPVYSHVCLCRKSWRTIYRTKIIWEISKLPLAKSIGELIFHNLNSGYTSHIWIHTKWIGLFGETVSPKSTEHLARHACWTRSGKMGRCGWLPAGAKPEILSIAWTVSKEGYESSGESRTCFWWAIYSTE